MTCALHRFVPRLVRTSAGAGVLSAWILLAGLMPTARAQTLSVRDVNIQTTDDLTVTQSVVFGGALYSITTARSVASGAVLRSGGTAETTQPLLDVTGKAFVGATDLVVVGGALFIATPDGLWRSDGTPAGTRRVVDWSGYPVSGSTTVARVGTSPAALYYAYSPSYREARLIRVDAATGAVQQLAAIDDFSSGGSTSILTATEAGAYVYFLVRKMGTFGGQTTSLWRTDATAAPTRLSDAFAGQIVALGADVYVPVTSASLGDELGRGRGTSVFVDRDIYPGGGSSTPLGLTVLGTRLVFTADDGTNGRQLWTSDGTEAGTVPLTSAAGGGFDAPTTLGATAYVFRTPIGGPTELWATDGTAAGTARVATLPAYSNRPNLLTAAGGRLYFAGADAAGGVELWTSDGTEAGTRRVRDIVPGPDSSTPFQIAADGAGAYVWVKTGPSGLLELWRTDGTEAGTRFVYAPARTTRSSDPDLLTRVGGLVFFVATDGKIGRELWVTDGTPGGTRFAATPVSYRTSTDHRQLTAFEGRLYYYANDAAYGIELMTSDGTDAGTGVVKDLIPGNSARDEDWGFVAVGGGRLYFTPRTNETGHELWTTDGTAAGTRLVRDLTPGSLSTTFEENGGFAGLGSTMLFSASGSTTGQELWKTDGTEAGTVRVRDINPGLGDSRPQTLTTLGTRVVFTADDGTSGRELWASDGTDAGTVRLADTTPGSAGSTFGGNVVIGSMAYTLANPGTATAALWRTDGTPAGTARVAATPGATALTAAGTRVFFAATDAASGTELWTSDGTEAGTVRVRDIYPGTASSSPTNLAADASRLYFSADDGANGRELWTSDGTAAGTRLAADARAGGGSGAPGRAAFLPGVAVFAATHPMLGRELFYLSTPVSAEVPATTARAALRLSPTPAATHATLRLTAPVAGPLDVRVVDLLGREVAIVSQREAAAGDVSLDLPVATLAPGVYVVRARLPGGEVQSARLVVAR